MERKYKFELTLHPSKTTYLNDFRTPKLVRVERFSDDSRKGLQKPKYMRRKPYVPLDLHTMQPWTDPQKKVPFNLLWKPKEMIRTSPLGYERVHPITPEPFRYDVIDSRPRRYMTPAISMDDIKDRETREMVIKDIYETSLQRANAEITFKYVEREIPITSLEKCRDPVLASADFSIFRPIPVRYKQIGKEWETKQYVSVVDPERHHFMNYQHKLNVPVGIDQFNSLISDDERKEIRDVVDRDEIRESYDKLKPGYAGYVPQNVRGPLRKNRRST